MSFASVDWDGSVFSKEGSFFPVGKLNRDWPGGIAKQKTVESSAVSSLSQLFHRFNSERYAMSVADESKQRIWQQLFQKHNETSEKEPPFSRSTSLHLILAVLIAVPCQKPAKLVHIRATVVDYGSSLYSHLHEKPVLILTLADPTKQKWKRLS